MPKQILTLDEAIVVVDSLETARSAVHNALFLLSNKKGIPVRECDRLGRIYNALILPLSNTRDIYAPAAKNSDNQAPDYRGQK